MIEKLVILNLHMYSLVVKDLILHLYQIIMKVWIYIFVFYNLRKMNTKRQIIILRKKFFLKKKKFLIKIVNLKALIYQNKKNLIQTKF